MERKENFSEYCHDYLCQQLDAYEGCDCYACDLAYKITEGCNIDGTLTYSTFTAKCYLQAWWDDCSDFSDFEKWNFTERINTLIAENYNAVGEYIKKNHSSYDGFISFMSADVNDWLDEWLEDDRQLSYLLFYLVEILRNERGELESLDGELYYPVHDSVCSYCYAYPATDKAREEKAQVELREAQEEAMRKYQLKLPLEF